MFNFPIPEDFLTRIAKDRRVSDGELKALRLALEKQKSQEIADQLGISEAAARKRLGEVYKKFEIKGSGPGKLASLKLLIERQFKGNPGLAESGDHGQSHDKSHDIATSTTELKFDKAPISHIGDRPYWQDVPTLNLFEGRERPLASLSEWISGPAGSPKLLAICGMGGIGKTYLALKLVETLRGRFNKTIWITLRSSQQPAELLAELLIKLQSPLDKSIDKSIDKVVSSIDISNIDIPNTDISNTDISNTDILNKDNLEPSDSHQKTTDHLNRQPSAASLQLLIQKVVELMAQQRCLIVLDGFETVFRSYSQDLEQGFSSANSGTEGIASKTFVGLPASALYADKTPTFDANRQQQASLYKEGFAAYGSLLEAIKQRARQPPYREGSCVVLTSREKPKELYTRAIEESKVRLYTLEGLKKSESKALLTRLRLTGTAAEYEQMINRYDGHPMALRLAANTVKDFFFGSIHSFLDQKISVFDDLNRVIKAQFQRLPPIEQEVMYWLAINHRPCSLKELEADIVTHEHKRELLYTLQSLERRSLIQFKAAEQAAEGVLFHLHPIVAEYILDRFVRAVFQDVIRGKLEFFNNYALMKADAADELREFQLEKVVYPLLSRLQNFYGAIGEVDSYLTERLGAFRAQNAHRLGYAGGNFVNLLVQLSQGQQLLNKDFSEMTIWQADLQAVQLREVSFNRCNIDRSVFTETLSDVMAIAHSHTPLTPLLLAGDAHGVVHLWRTEALDLASGQKFAEWVAHSGWVRAIAFVPNQPLVVTGSDDNTLKLWRLPVSDRQPPRPVLVWQHSTNDWIYAVALSPDGSLIASGGDAPLALYRTGDAQPIFPRPQCPANQTDSIAGDAAQQGVIAPVQPKSSRQKRTRSLAFSSDGQWLASSGNDCTVYLWATADLLDLAATPEPIKLMGHTASVYAVCFSPDAQQLISAGEDSTIRVWDVGNKTCQKVLDRHSDRIRSLAVSPDGRFLASGGDDCQVILWDLSSLKHIQDLSTDRSRIWSVAFQQQKDKLLLSAGGDRQTLKLWQVSLQGDATDEHLAEMSQDEREPQSSPQIQPMRTYRGYAGGIRAIAFLGHSRLVGGGDRRDLSVWDSETGATKASLALHQGRIWAIAVDSQNTRIASASDDHTVRLWDTATGQCLTTLSGHSDWVRTVAFSPQGRFLASGGDDGVIRIWNTASGFCLATLKQPSQWIRSVSFSPTNSRYLISGGEDQIVRRWDRKENQFEALAQHDHRICSVAYSPNGKLIASGSDDATVILWDVDTAEIIHRFKRADLGIKAVAFSPSGQYLAAGGDDHLVYIWDLSQPNPEKHCYVLRPQDYTGLAGGIRAIAFSPDSRYIVSGGLDEMIRKGDLNQIENPSQRILKPLIERDRPYEKTKIKGIKGLSNLQMENLLTLGAINRTTSLLL
jgi:WD40 repeat protein/DNA-binding CsgD family transcriptional regulator